LKHEKLVAKKRTIEVCGERVSLLWQACIAAQTKHSFLCKRICITTI